jgi:hypothetical protein
VQMGFVLDVQALGCESRKQFCRDDILHSHGFSPMAASNDDKTLTSIAATRRFVFCQVLQVSATRPHNRKR